MATGSEVLFELLRGQFKAASDALVCCLHWNMITNGFRCIGKGEEPAAADVQASELLPAGWNASQDYYVLQYRPSEGNDLYLLKVIRMEDTLLVHVLRPSDEKVATLNLTTADYASNDFSSFHKAYKGLEDLQRKFRTDIIAELGASSKQHTERAKETLRTERLRPEGRSTDDDDPLRVAPWRPAYQPSSDWGQPSGPFDLGRRDLDPLAGGGGMVMDPFRSGSGRFDPNAGLPQRLPGPRGGVPPGARFDPFGPPDPDGQFRRGPGPDPDHLPPPGYDDMFM